MKVCLFFTFGMSLKAWKDAGLFDREVALYKKLVAQGIQVTFVTYGDDSDMEYQGELYGIEIVPIFAGREIPKAKLMMLWHSIRFPFKEKSRWKAFDVIKTNQMLGGWSAMLAYKFSKARLIVRCGYDMYECFLRDGGKGIKKWMYFILSSIRVDVSSVGTLLKHNFPESAKPAMAQDSVH